MLEMGFDAEIVDDATLSSGKVRQSRKSSQKLRPSSFKTSRQVSPISQLPLQNLWYLWRQEEAMMTKTTPINKTST